MGMVGDFSLKGQKSAVVKQSEAIHQIHQMKGMENQGNLFYFLLHAGS